MGDFNYTACGRRLAVVAGLGVMLAGVLVPVTPSVAQDPTPGPGTETADGPFPEVEGQPPPEPSDEQSIPPGPPEVADPTEPSLEGLSSAAVAVSRTGGAPVAAGRVSVAADGVDGEASMRLEVLDPAALGDSSPVGVGFRLDVASEGSDPGGPVVDEPGDQARSAFVDRGVVAPSNVDVAVDLGAEEIPAVLQGRLGLELWVGCRTGASGTVSCDDAVNLATETDDAGMSASFDPVATVQQVVDRRRTVEGHNVIGSDESIALRELGVPVPDSGSTGPLSDVAAGDDTGSVGQNVDDQPQTHVRVQPLPGTTPSRQDEPSSTGDVSEFPGSGPTDPDVDLSPPDEKASPTPAEVEVETTETSSPEPLVSATPTPSTVPSEPAGEDAVPSPSATETTFSPSPRATPTTSPGPSPSPSPTSASAPSETPTVTEPNVGGSAASDLGDWSCVGDGLSGRRVQPVVVADEPDADLVEQVRSTVAEMEAMVAATADAQGDVRGVRWVHGTDCAPTVVTVSADASTMSFDDVVAVLQDGGLDVSDRKYVAFTQAQGWCGASQLFADDRLVAGNANNGGEATYAAVGLGCWDRLNSVHELVHLLGAVQPSAPHGTAEGHCTDGWDPLCQADPGSGPVVEVCPEGDKMLLDCGGDDYFDVAPASDEYLAEHWNVADSGFLVGARTLPNTVGIDAPEAFTMVVVGSDPSGPNGDYSATAVPDLADHEVGLFTGSAQLSYDIPVVDPESGPAPQVTLSYDSGAIDGMNPSSNNQSGPVGIGWSLNVASITRVLETCALPQAPEDKCAPDDDRYFLNLDGRRSELVRDIPRSCG